MELFENKVGRPSNETLKKRKIFKISVIVSTILLLLSIGIFVIFKLNVFNLKGASYGNVSITRTSVDPKQYNDGNRDWPLYVKRMDPYLGYVAEAASKYNIDPALIMAVIMVESHANTNVSNYCCCGLMAVGYQWVNYTCSQLKQPKIGIMEGTRLLREWTNVYGKQGVERVACAYINGYKSCTDKTYQNAVVKYMAIIRKLYNIKFGNGGSTPQTNPPKTTASITLSCPSTLKVNEVGNCTTNLSGVKISITKTNLASGYTTSFTTKSNDKVKNLKYTKTGTVTVTASKSGYATITKKVTIVANTTTKKTTTKAPTASNGTLIQGQKIILNKVPIYASATIKTKSGTKTGTYYIWSATQKNGRIRITVKSSYVGKSDKITGWINVKDISSSYTTTKTTSKKVTTTKKTTSKTIAQTNNRKNIFIGDSRCVGIQSAISTTEKNKSSWICKVSQGYSWFTQTAIPTLNSLIKSNEYYNVYINLGVNDVYNINKYINYFNNMVNNSKYKKCKIIIVSVNPINDAKAKSYGYLAKNSDVTTFNSKLRSGISSKLTYCNTYDKVKNNFGTTDGIHYNNTTSKNIYNHMLNCK